MPVRIMKLTQALIDAGIPINGVQAVGNVVGEPPDRIADSAAIDFRPEATQQQRDAAAAILAASTPATPIGDYIASHFLNRRKFIAALYQLEQGINGHTTPGANLLADYQTALTAAMNIVGTLPTPYLNNLNALRDLDGVAIPVASMTLAQCRQFQATLRGWLLTRAVFADIASGNLD